MKKSSLRVIFMGTPAFSVPPLQALVNSHHQVVAVYSQPPRPKDRGHHLHKSPVHEFALTQDIPVFTPLNFKNPQDHGLFASHQADVAIVVAYGLILPKVILDTPRLGCLNIHASLLPRWRGAAPIQRAIEAGDAQTGLTIMKMDVGLDTGPMLLKKSIDIGDETTTMTLHDTLSEMGGSLLLEALDGYIAQTLPLVPQPEEGVIYASKLSREEARIDWRLPAVVLDRKIRAFTPWPGVWFEHEGKKIKVMAADVVDTFPQGPGTILDNQLTVACGQGALRIKTLQRPGGAALDASTFLRGYALPVGTLLPCPAIS